MTDGERRHQRHLEAVQRKCAWVTEQKAKRKANREYRKEKKEMNTRAKIERRVEKMTPEELFTRKEKLRLAASIMWEDKPLKSGKEKPSWMKSKEQRRVNAKRMKAKRELHHIRWLHNQIAREMSR